MRLKRLRGIGEDMSILMFLLGLLPIIILAIVLMVFKKPAFVAAIAAFVTAFVLAYLVWKEPLDCLLTASLEGVLMAIWPIIIVIIAAVFTYRLTLYTGAMDKIKAMLTSVSSDKRVLVLLIAWCFGGFMEGMAGFGTAIAIPASILVALSFDPLFACFVCLIANGAPTPFGSIGIPTVTLASLTGLENEGLSFATTCELAPFIILCPILIVMITGGGIKGMRGMWLVTIMSGVSFLFGQMIVSYFAGAELAVVVGAVLSLVVTIILGKNVKGYDEYEMKDIGKIDITLKDGIIAWLPFILIFVFLLLTSKIFGPINTFLNQFGTSTVIYAGDEPNTMSFKWINTPGIWIFLSAIIGGAIQGAKAKDFLKVLGETFIQMKETMITMIAVLACAKVMSYAGMISSISAFVIASTGMLYPIFAPWIGALGTFVTGSGTNSGVLFGTIQLEASKELAIDSYFMVALNSLGVAAGKMLSPQSLAIALSSVGAKGKDNELMKKIAPYGLIFLIIMSFMAIVLARLFII